MRQLAKIGFTQCYTYFTWKNSRHELTEYVDELAWGPEQEYFRPNFFTNTPDILNEYLVHGGPAGVLHALRARGDAEPDLRHLLGLRALRERAGARGLRGVPRLREVRAQAARARRADAAVHRAASTRSGARTRRCSTSPNVACLDTQNDQLIAYVKQHAGNAVICVVNLDPHHAQEGSVDRARRTSACRRRSRVTDLLSGERFDWRIGPELRAARPVDAPGAHPAGRAAMSDPGHWFEAEPLWFKTAVFYEIHIRGFFDGNGDGSGDFRGLTEKLDYLQWLGVDCIWLLPFYKSPLRDGGYDISDYFTIHPDYGVGRGRARLHRGGPPARHPRDRRPRHEPHVVATTRGSRSRARAPTTPSATGTSGRTPCTATRTRGSSSPTPRRRTGRGTTQAGAYFWHRFFSHQPDLNFDNPEVQEAMLEVLRFWLDLGLDGFRLDAVPVPVRARGHELREPARDARLPQARARRDRRELPRPRAARRGQPVAGRRRRVLRRRRRVPHVLPLPGHAAHVHERAPGGGDADVRDPRPDARRSPTTASGACSCATTTS